MSKFINDLQQKFIFFFLFQHSSRFCGILCATLFGSSVTSFWIYWKKFVWFSPNFLFLFLRCSRISCGTFLFRFLVNILWHSVHTNRTINYLAPKDFHLFRMRRLIAKLFLSINDQMLLTNEKIFFVFLCICFPIKILFVTSAKQNIQVKT